MLTGGNCTKNRKEKTMKKRRRKRYTWKFENMHASLQIAVFILGCAATLGYMLLGTWILAVIMGY